MYARQYAASRAVVSDTDGTFDEHPRRDIETMSTPVGALEVNSLYAQ